MSSWIERNGEAKGMGEMEGRERRKVGGGPRFNIDE